MNFEIFLYGRTRTHDYTDMHIPSWLTYSSKYYSEFRKIISHIFNIRDSVSEEQSDLLNDTGNCFTCYIGHEICILCRCCSISGEDEFGRSIFSTEGFICRSDDQKLFWNNIQNMIAFLLTRQKKFYDEYIEKFDESQKPVASEKFQVIKKYSETELDDIMVSAGIKKQFTALQSAVSYRILPFGFVIGKQNKAIFTYPCSNELINDQIYFTDDFCTENSKDEFWKNKYKALNIKSESKKYFTYLDISYSPQNRLRYRFVIGNQPDTKNIVSDIPFVSYEQEEGITINLNDLNTLFLTVSTYVYREGYKQFPVNKYIFEKW